MHIVIVGNGIAGSTAALKIREGGDHEITMISDESEFPFARTALMYVFVGQLKQRNTLLYEPHTWREKNINLFNGKVVRLNSHTKSIFMSSGKQIFYDKLIIATGSRPVMPDIPGTSLHGVQGLYHLADLQTLENTVRTEKGRAVIVGGGLIAVELAEMLHSRHIPVTMLVREKSYWANVLPPEESAMITAHIRSKGIEVIVNEEAVEILGSNGNVCGVRTKYSGEVIQCTLCGIAIGVSPNTDLVKNTNIHVSRGILVNEYLETSSEDIYAIGDCAELQNADPGRRTVEAVWYCARTMGHTIARTLCGERTSYTQGVWYNSAKFFDVEYQVYGEIPSEIPPSVHTMYWKHPKENKSIRINYDKSSGVVLGFNLMGIRYRSSVCLAWIIERAHISKVVKELSAANFDPEFSLRYEAELKSMYHTLL